MIDFSILSDGWIKIPASDFPLGLKTEANQRLLLGLNQVLLRVNGKTVLIDCGLGGKWSREEVPLLDFQTPRMLLRNLRESQVSPEDIDIVILSHLHFDHSGGGTYTDETGIFRPTFSNARYFVQRKELEFARNPGREFECDFKETDWQPLIESGQLNAIEGESQIVPGINVFLAPGHTPGHQVVLIRDGSHSLFYPGDLFSTPEHSNLMITTSYEVDTETLLESRKYWLKQAVNEQWDCVFCHRIRNAVSKIPGD